MKQISRPVIMALLISFALFACNSNEESKTGAVSSDSTATTTTMADDTPQNQDMDAVKVAPGLYTVAKDSMGIRVLNVLYKPGDSSAMHSHPDNALYVIAPSKAEFTGKDGKKQVMSMDKGMTMIVPADTHSVKNVGNTNAKVVLIEVNRPK
jgi:quercetin dioxygenase-like cupin family protein